MVLNHDSEKMSSLILGARGGIVWGVLCREGIRVDKYGIWGLHSVFKWYIMEARGEEWGKCLSSYFD